jgi:hypothetical protein
MKKVSWNDEAAGRARRLLEAHPRLGRAEAVAQVATFHVVVRHKWHTLLLSR